MRRCEHKVILDVYTVHFMTAELSTFIADWLTYRQPNRQLMAHKLIKEKLDAVTPFHGLSANALQNLRNFVVTRLAD
jgi:fermentation-respiration switch protein FrsA (DUF1100 family)